MISGGLPEYPAFKTSHLRISWRAVLSATINNLDHAAKSEESVKPVFALSTRPETIAKADCKLRG
jgi:hypothetical protein